jgi:hypothetical protein
MELENLKYPHVNQIAVNDTWKPDAFIFTSSVLDRIIWQKKKQHILQNCNEYRKYEKNLYGKIHHPLQYSTKLNGKYDNISYWILEFCYSSSTTVLAKIKWQYILQITVNLIVILHRSTQQD